jgi:hypothetical protein
LQQFLLRDPSTDICWDGDTSASSKAASAATRCRRDTDDDPMRVISDVADPWASVSTLKTFAVENGK